MDKIKSIPLSFTFSLVVANPEIIVIGGGVAQAGKLLFGPIKRTVKKRALPGPAKTAKIVPSQLEENVSIIGAVALALEKIFKVYMIQS